jgi:hypothetical protein
MGGRYVKLFAVFGHGTASDLEIFSGQDSLDLDIAEWIVFVFLLDQFAQPLLDAQRRDLLAEIS